MINQISIVIVIFHSEQIIDKTVKFLLDQEIIIIDNSNNKKLKEIFKKTYPKIKYILSKENLGYSAGNNLGIKNASNDYILVLNPDCIVSKEAINNLLKYINDIHYFGILCPNLSNNQCADFSKKNNFKPVTVDYKSIGLNLISGCALLLNKQVLNNEIFFDEKIFIYKEDTDLVKRLNDKGLPVYYLPNCSVKHMGTASHKKQIEYEMQLSRNFHWTYGNVYFYKKHFGTTYAAIKWGPKLFSSLVKTLFYFLTINKNKFLIYKNRLLGIITAFLNKKAWYRPKIDTNENY